MTFTQQFLEETVQIVKKIDTQAVDRLVALLASTRAAGGRLFILGVGGSAGNASHAVNDFRKITGIEAYAPTDNVSELTARTNDEGWSTVFERWLRVSRLRADDMLLIFSVGGGNLEKQVSPNLVEALKYARIGGHKDRRHRGPRWRLHRTSGRCVRADSSRECGTYYAAFRSFSGCRVASAGFASRLEAGANQVGIGGLRKCPANAQYFWTATA